jgi:hypothetical protein
MSESVLGELERFFDALPSWVRDDLSFMMVMLSDEELILADGDPDFETLARGLFAARTHVGRMADLIAAVSVFDVYFAMSARKRFDLTRPKLRQALPHDGAGSVSPVLARYAAEADAIADAKRQWTELRGTRLAPAAIAAALAARLPNRKRNPRTSAPSTAQTSKPGETHDAAIP